MGNPWNPVVVWRPLFDLCVARSKLFDRCRAGLLAEQKTVMERQASHLRFRQGTAYTTWQGDANICTNQGLLVTGTIYMSLLGSQGLREVVVTQRACDVAI